MKVKIVKKILADNDEAAAKNRARFAAKGLFALDIMSGPGAGKTTLLEKTLPYLAAKHGLRAAVVEGDIEGDIDGARIDRLGVPVVQLNTRGACHLDATMLRTACKEFALDALDLLIVENVGNLVCPAEFDLGQDRDVVLLSLPEGDDKPIKYPAMFRRADVVLITKMDLAPLMEFSLEKVREACARLESNPQTAIMELSARTGAGVEAWGDWLVAVVREKKGDSRPCV